MKPERPPALPPAPTRSERRQVLILAAAVMLVTTVPYLVGWSAQGQNWRFTGFLLSVEDGNAFIGKMLSGTVGEWLFRTPYTAFEQRGFPIFLPYLLLGKLASPPDLHDKLVALYHAFRVAAGMLALLATYDLISLFVAQPRARRLALVLAGLGGGLGWLLFILGRQEWLGSLPLEFYSPESFGFLSLFVYPHYALARALLLWGVATYLTAVSRIDENRGLAAEGLKVGGLWLLASLVQPFTGAVAGLVVGGYLAGLALWQLWAAKRQRAANWPSMWKVTRLTLWAAILPAPFVLYNLLSTQLDPFLKTWTAQSPFASPHPVHYLLAYAPVLPFALLGARELGRAEVWHARFPVIWVLLVPLLAYAPVSIQRRLPEGAWVAVVVLAVLGLQALPGRGAWRAVLVLVLTLPSTALILVQSSALAARPAEPFFRPAEEVAAFRCLADQERREAVVLSSYETGNALPAWAPVFVAVGHGPESAGMDELLPWIDAFYDTGTTAQARLALLQELDVDYVF
ncbi:MAG TPA: hypothetical protein VLC52_01450, partial [Anaerolineae bacterium]|nr:hypothetical protein [Anaerolineae bacterium]